MAEERRRLLFSQGGGIPTDGLIAEYLFMNNTNDTSGSGNNASNTNITFTSSGLSGIVMAGAFNGSNSVGVIANAFTDFASLSVWVKEASSTGTIVSIGAQKLSSVYSLFDVMHVSTNIQAQFRSGSGTAHAGVQFANPFSSTWHHLVITTKGYDNTTNTDIKVYIDGSLISTTGMSTSGSKATILQKSLIGAFYDFESVYRIWFNGQMTALRLYDRELTASEVTMLYNEGTL